MKLSNALARMVSAEDLAQLDTAVGNAERESLERTVEAVTTPGALDPAVGSSKLTTAGTDAVTLADGLYAGQRKHVVMIVGTATPVADITPANYADGTTVSLSAVGESVILEWDGSTWHTIGGSGFAIT
jgi:hypothetical protein